MFLRAGERDLINNTPPRRSAPVAREAELGVISKVLHDGCEGYAWRFLVQGLLIRED